MSHALRPQRLKPGFLLGWNIEACVVMPTGQMQAYSISGGKTHNNGTGLQFQGTFSAALPLQFVGVVHTAFSAGSTSIAVTATGASSVNDLVVNDVLNIYTSTGTISQVSISAISITAGVATLTVAYISGSGTGHGVNDIVALTNHNVSFSADASWSIVNDIPCSTTNNAFSMLVTDPDGVSNAELVLFSGAYAGTAKATSTTLTVSNTVATLSAAFYKAHPSGSKVQVYGCYQTDNQGRDALDIMHGPELLQPCR
jgi:hypothetical protein